MHHRAETESTGAPRLRIGVGAMVVLVLVVFGVAVAFTALTRAGGSVPLTDVSATPGSGGTRSAIPTKTPTSLYVHVTGAVNNPGLVNIASGSRVVDAISAAGGFSADADTSVLNLARIVNDGEQIQVPRPGENPSASAPQEGGTSPGSGLINLNRATAVELEQLPRIGPALAKRIIDWRSAHGGFTAVDDLLKVPGIGSKILEGFADKVTV